MDTTGILATVVVNGGRRCVQKTTLWWAPAFYLQFSGNVTLLSPAMEGM